MLDHYTVIFRAHAKKIISKILHDKPALYNLEFIQGKHTQQILANQHTLYFYCNRKNEILPIYSTDTDLEKLFSPKNGHSIYHIVDLLIKMGGTKFDSVILHTYYAGEYYFYVRIRGKSGDAVYDINAKLADALNIAHALEAPIYASEAFLDKYGILVTKELLQKSIIEIG